MKIGSFENKPLPSSKTAADAKAGAAKAGDTSAEAPGARVELSSAASLLAAAPAGGDFDAEKVERISRAIREGRFEVNAEAIADKLIAQTAEMVGRKS